jgi:hypothetical protein
MSQSSVSNTVVALFACAFLASSSPALGSTIFVPADHATIQAAIDAAATGDEIVVAPGTYNELIDFSGKAITLRSSDGAAVTTIDGTAKGGSVVQCTSGEGLGTELRGFTITGGIGTLDGSIRLGGGVFTRGSSPTIEECVVIGNTAFNGGAMANYGGGRPLVLNCWLGGNTAVQGGGVFNFDSSPTVVNCVFTGNHATVISGGIDNSSSSNPTVVNCTFSRNTTDGPGGGMTTGAGASSALRVENCIFWENADSGGMDESAQIHVGAGLPTVRFSCIQGLVAGGAFDSGSNTDNIGDDPAFVDSDGCDDAPGTLDDELRLSASSPCVDAGDNAAVPAGVTTDLSGGPRIVNATVDMGAHEFSLANAPPDCSKAVLSMTSCWPPNHKFRLLDVLCVTDPNGDLVTITITGITQDEAMSGPGRGSGATCPDAVLVSADGDDNPELAGLRCEREGRGDGRVYKVHFTATDPAGASCSGSATFCVPHDRRGGTGGDCVDSGQDFDSTAACPQPAAGGGAGDGGGAEAAPSVLSLEEFDLLTPDPLFLRGDVNWDESLDLSDAVATLCDVFLSDGAVDCSDAADFNDDGLVDISDPIGVLAALFIDASQMPPGALDLAADPTDDPLGCE